MAARVELFNRLPISVPGSNHKTLRCFVNFNACNPHFNVNDWLVTQGEREKARQNCVL
jgi:hypothetical protein